MHQAVCFSLYSHSPTTGSETTSERVDWVVNKYRHIIDIFHLKDGNTQTEQLNGSDMLTNFSRNQITPAGHYDYDIQITPIQLQEVMDRLLQRPAWVEKEFTDYNFSTIPRWSQISATLDSVFADIPPYELRGIGFSVSDN